MQRSCWTHCGYFKAFQNVGYHIFSWGNFFRQPWRISSLLPDNWRDKTVSVADYRTVLTIFRLKVTTYLKKNLSYFSQIWRCLREVVHEIWLEPTCSFNRGWNEIHSIHIGHGNDAERKRNQPDGQQKVYARQRQRAAVGKFQDSKFPKK